MEILKKYVVRAIQICRIWFLTVVKIVASDCFLDLFNMSQLEICWNCHGISFSESCGHPVKSLWGRNKAISSEIELSR